MNMDTRTLDGEENFRGREELNIKVFLSTNVKGELIIFGKQIWIGTEAVKVTSQIMLLILKSMLDT